MKLEDIFRRGLYGNAGARFAMVCCLSLGFAARSQAANFTSFDVPGTLSNGSPIVINANGVIAGTYYDALPCGPCEHGFVRAVNGTLTPFDAPDAWYTIVESMNSNGVITGFYKPWYSNNNRGFIRSADGNFTVFDASQTPYIDTNVMSINTAGAVTGYFGGYSTDGTPPPVHSFVRAANGTITIFDVPDGNQTYAQSINDVGVIAGSYRDASQVWHGFVRAADGAISTFDAKNTNIDATWVQSVSSSGDILGSYMGTAVDVHGFLRTADGKIDRFDVLHANRTNPTGMSPSGILTGWYYTDTASGGFVRDAGKNGKITTFNVPFANGTNTSPSTVTDDGTVAGWYWDTVTNMPKGFFGKP